MDFTTLEDDLNIVSALQPMDGSHNTGWNQHPDPEWNQHRDPEWNQHPGPGGNQHPDRRWTQHPDQRWTPHPDRGWTRHPDRGWTQHPDPGCTQHPDQGWNQHPHPATTGGESTPTIPTAKETLQHITLTNSTATGQRNTVAHTGNQETKYTSPAVQLLMTTSQTILLQMRKVGIHLTL